MWWASSAKGPAWPHYGKEGTGITVERACSMCIQVCGAADMPWAPHRAGLAQPGKIERGARAAACANHLHQLHVCLPAGRGRTRLLYRMSLDFLHWTRAVPGIQAFWRSIANQARQGEGLCLFWPLQVHPCRLEHRRARQVQPKHHPCAAERAEDALGVGACCCPPCSTNP